MKYLRKALKIGFWVLIFAMLIAPIGLLYQLTQAEMAAYEAPASPSIKETSLGTPRQATRMDIQEYIIVKGQFTSNQVAFQMLTQAEPDRIHWIVSLGEEVQIGQVVGYYDGEAVISEINGLLEDIKTEANDAYLKIRCLSPLVLQATVDDATLAILQRENSGLALVDGGDVTLVYAANIKNADGSTDVLLSIDTDRYEYGEEVSLMMYTSLCFPNALVVQSNCVYQKNGEYYVRQVTENGTFVAEVKVEVSYDNGSYACVSGISEGQWFDSGYAAIMGGDDA